MGPIRPEGHGYLVGGTWIRSGHFPAQSFEQGIDRLAGPRGSNQEDVPRHEVDLKQDLADFDHHCIPTTDRGAEDRLPERRQYAGRRRPAVTANFAIAALEHFGREDSAD